jgi:hypothetical protein
MAKLLKILLLGIWWLCSGVIIGLVVCLVVYFVLGEVYVRLYGTDFFMMGNLAWWIGSVSGISLYFLKRKMSRQKPS